MTDMPDSRRGLSDEQADALRAAAGELRNVSLVLEMADARRLFLEEKVREVAWRELGVQFEPLESVERIARAINAFADCVDRIADAAFNS